MTSTPASVVDAEPYDATDVRRWVRSKLDLPTNSDLNATRLRFLHELTEENFVPAITHQQMAWVLEEEATGLSKLAQEPSYFQADRQQELAVDVAKFAAQFFSMNAALRLAHWKELRVQVKGYLPLEAWLDHLHGAIHLEVPNLVSESETLQTILQHVREIFVLIPPQQAARRRELISATEFKEWSLQKAIERARFNYSEWIKLVPGYLDALESHYLKDAQVELAKIATAQREAAQRTAQKEGSDWSSNRTGWFIAASIVLGLLKVISLTPSNTTSAPARSYYTPPQKITPLKPRRYNDYPIQKRERIDFEPSIVKDEKTRKVLEKVLGIKPGEEIKVYSEIKTAPPQPQAINPPKPNLPDAQQADKP